MTELPTDYDNLLYYLEQQFPATQGHIPLRTCIMNMKHRVADLEQKLTEARKDTDRLQAVTLNLWSLNWNSRAGAWTVQKRDQTVGNIACDFSLREAITLAMKKGQSE